MRHSAFILAGATAAFAASSAVGLDIGLALNHESEYTTNSGLSERDELEEWIHSPGATLQGSHEGPAVTLDVNYEINRRIHQQNLFDDENEAAGTANLVWHALPERLDFIVDHSRTQSAIRAIRVSTPDNRQETANTTAGPLLRFNLRGDDEIQLQYKYGTRSSERTDTDAVTHEGSTRYILAFSPSNSLTLEAINRQVQYENRLASDIDYKIGQLSWNRTASDLVYSLSGGYTRAARTKNRDDVDGAVFAVEVDWQAYPATGVRFTLAREFRDQAESLSGGLFENDLDFSVSSDLTEVFTNERAAIVVNQRLGRRTTMLLGATFDDEDYEDATRDVESQALSLGVTRKLTPQLDLALAASYQSQEYTDEGVDVDRLRGDLSLVWSLGRRLHVGLGVGYDDSDSNASLRSYHEWNTRVRVSYDAILPAR